MIHKPQNPSTGTELPLDIFSENNYKTENSIYYISSNKLYYNRSDNVAYLNNKLSDEDLRLVKTHYPNDETFGINYDTINKNYTFYFALNKYIYSQTKG